MNASSESQVRYKRKRKKTFLNNAKGYGKKGMYGRGTQLDADTYQYFVRILEVYKEGFPSEEEKCRYKSIRGTLFYSFILAIFVNNVFQHTEDQEIDCCCNQIGCRVIQTFLPFASNAYLKRYLDVLFTDLRPLCANAFASHVLQTLTDIACEKSLSKEVDDDFREYCRAATVKISKFLLNNLEDYVWDNYGNHIIRTVIKNLGGLSNEAYNSTDEYKSIVKEYSNRLISWPQFNDLPYSELTSGLLQILLTALKTIDKKLLKVYVKKLLSESFSKISGIEYGNVNSNALPDAFLSKAVIMLLECCIEIAAPKLYTQLYLHLFAGKLVKLSKMKTTNFSVQKLLNYCTEKTEFEAMFEELSVNFGEIVEVGHTGVILALGQGCKRLSTKQGLYVQNIMKCYDCCESDLHQLDIVMCLCKGVKYNLLKEHKDVDLQNAKFNLHGTLIVQLILEFNKPIKIINSILNINGSDLKKIFCNRMGCHILDSFMKSQYVGEKSREKLIRILQGFYQDLVSDKYGSRSFEAIWNAACLKSKKNMMNELAHKDGTWSNTQFGKIISSKIHLQLYKRNKEDWGNVVAKESSKVDVKELFADIIGK